MCTVTYIPISKNSFILTSSRDVPFIRKKALFPKRYLDKNVEIVYPKDKKAGGTWIGYSSKKRLICLLNGGFENHYSTIKSNTKYRKSRGLIVLDLLKENEINTALSKIDLNQIEPFTLVIVDWNEKLNLMEFVWDGKTKHIKKLKQKNYIWSSATLYDNDMKKLRNDWFFKTEVYDLKSILNFHHTAGVGNFNVGIMMKREKVGTVSITQVCKKTDSITMNYEEMN